MIKIHYNKNDCQHMSAESCPIGDLADYILALLYDIAGWLSLGLGALGLLVTLLRNLNSSVPSSATLSAVVDLVSVLFILFGIYVHQQLRRRLTHWAA